MSDTPKTDAAVWQIEGGEMVCPKFARHLERELNAANERIKRLKSFISEVARPWECTCRFTVWNLYNKKTAECDCCRAEGLLKEAKP